MPNENKNPNPQQGYKGDTATESMEDVPSFMKPEVTRVVPSVKKGGSLPMAGGINTPGNPER